VRQISDICLLLDYCTYTPGATIIDWGQPADRFVIVVSGSPPPPSSSFLIVISLHLARTSKHIHTHTHTHTGKILIELGQERKGSSHSATQSHPNDLDAVADLKQEVDEESRASLMELNHGDYIGDGAMLGL
jgi:hypothetical protein